MPRKTNSTRKARAKTRLTEAQGRRAQVAPRQARLPQGLDRHRRADKRPPVIPGRLGGR